MRYKDRVPYKLLSEDGEGNSFIDLNEELPISVRDPFSDSLYSVPLFIPTLFSLSPFFSLNPSLLSGDNPIFSMEIRNSPYELLGPVSTLRGGIASFSKEFPFLIIGGGGAFKEEEEI